MKKIVILTGSELRHTYFRVCMGLNPEIQIVASYCEGLEGNLRSVLAKESSAVTLRERHLLARDQSESDFFADVVAWTPDRSNPRHLQKGQINDPACAEEIRRVNPDVLVAYGCSIIREPLLSAFKSRFINVHLGLSPYYRGSGTNYWPLVNAEPEYVGATFMHIDAGVDTGEIIHQIRARYCWGDSPSQIGNRLIRDMSIICQRIVCRFDSLPPVRQPTLLEPGKYYRKKDFTEQSVAALYRNFAEGLIGQYLDETAIRCEKAPLVQNPALLE